MTIYIFIIRTRIVRNKKNVVFAFKKWVEKIKNSEKKIAPYRKKKSLIFHKFLYEQTTLNTFSF